MGREHLLMNGAHGRRSKMNERTTHESRLKSEEFLRIKRFAVAPARAGSIAGRTGVSTIDPPSCTVTVSWSPTFTRARSMSAASKMMPWEFPTLEMVLVTESNTTFCFAGRQERRGAPGLSVISCARAPLPSRLQSRALRIERYQKKN